MAGGFLALDGVEIEELRNPLSRGEVGQGFATVEDGKGVSGLQRSPPLCNIADGLGQPPGTPLPHISNFPPPPK